MKAIARITVAIIKACPLVKDVYFRGSFGLDNFIPFYSDLDLVLILKKIPQEEFRDMQAVLSYIRKIKKYNPFWQHTAILFDEELDTFKEFWYLYDTKPWRSVDGKIISQSDSFGNINLKLLLVSLWSSQIAWCRQLIFDLVSLNSSIYVFYPKLRKIKIIAERLDNLVKLTKERLTLKEYTDLQENLSFKNNSHYFNPQCLYNRHIKLAEDILFLIEKSAGLLFNRYLQKEEPEFIERQVEVEAEPDLVNFFKNLNLPYVQLIFSGYRGIYIIVKEDILKEEANKILKILSSLRKHNHVIYLYTPQMYSLSLKPWPIKLIYRNNEFNLNTPAHFLKEYYISGFFYNASYLKTCLDYPDYKNKLYDLLWEFLKTKLALEKNYLCRTRKIIAQQCLANRYLFEEYNQDFWRALESEDVVPHNMNVETIFNLNLNLSQDTLRFLKDSL